MGLGGGHILHLAVGGVGGGDFFTFPPKPSISPIWLCFSFGGCRLLGRMGLGVVFLGLGAVLGALGRGTPPP